MKYLLASLILALAATTAAAVKIDTPHPRSKFDIGPQYYPEEDAHLPYPTCDDCAATIHWEYVTEMPLTNL